MKIVIEIMRWIGVIIWIGWLISVLNGYPLDQYMSVLSIILTIGYFLTAGRD